MPQKSPQINFFILLVLCVLIAFGTTLFANWSQYNAAIQDFSYQDSNGKQGHLYQFDNRIVVLHFWASWCGPCREEMPQLVKQAKASPDVVFLLISADQSMKQMLDFMQDYQYPGNIVLIDDPKTAITKGHFNIDLFPETLILNKDKTLKQHFIGPANWENAI